MRKFVKKISLSNTFLLNVTALKYNVTPYYARCYSDVVMHVGAILVSLFYLTSPVMHVNIISLEKKRGQKNLYFFFKNGSHPFLVEDSGPRVSLRVYFPVLDLGGCAKRFLFGFSKKCMD